MPVPIPVKHEEHHDKTDHWGSSSSSHQADDHWTSATSTSNDEINPQMKSQPFAKSMRISAASVPNHSFGMGPMISRMEQSIEQKSNLLHTLLNGNDKSNRSDKKSNDSRKKNSTLDQSSPHQFMDMNGQLPELLPPPAAFGLALSPDANNGHFLSSITMPTPEQQQQFHDAIQQIQMQQFQQHHLQNEHQKMQEAMSSSVPQQLAHNSPLASQLPIPLPGTFKLLIKYSIKNKLSFLKLNFLFSVSLLMI